MLFELVLGYANDLARVVKEHSARTGRPLIERQYVLIHSDPS